MHQLFEEIQLTYLESAPIGVVVIDQTGLIRIVNAKAEEIFGYERTELIGQPMEMLLPQRFRDTHHKHRSDYFRRAHARPMGLGLELAGRRKDGTEFPVEVGLSQIQIQDRNLAVAFVTDITVRVQAAEALRRHATELESRVVERTREIERRRQVAEGLHDVLTILNTARPLEEILSHIVEQAHRLLATDAVAIYRQDGDGKPPQVVAARQLEEGSSRDGATFESVIPGHALRDRQNVGVADRADDETGSIARISRYRSVLAVPLNVKGEVYGNICLYYRSPRTFTAEDRELAVAFADQAALAIENERLREQAERSAVAAERSRLARDLHDAVTQTLFSTSLIADVLPKLWKRNQEEGERRLAELRELTRGALAEMRTLLLELRPSALAEANLADLLHQLAEAATGRARLPVLLHVSGEGEIPVEVKVALYRIAQESLNNVTKHSLATSATIKLIHALDAVHLSIEDNGRGFEVDGSPAGRLGLNIMRERAEAIHADLLIESEIGKGTSIDVVWRP
jgi:PAS domain S-box-containing protein